MLKYIFLNTEKKHKVAVLLLKAFERLQAATSANRISDPIYWLIWLSFV